MADHGERTHSEQAHGEQDDQGEFGSGETRITSPMEPYSMRAVGLGLVVLAVGLAVTFLLPLVA